MNKAVFLDRDGTIMKEGDYLHDPAQVEVFTPALAGLKQLADAGFLLFIVTNQSGVGRGYFTMDDVHKVNERVTDEFAKAGVRFERIYIAPEAPDKPSRGRKPSPQFLFDARDEFGLSLAECYMVGDKLIDLECGWNAGVGKCILVRTGYGLKVERESAGKLNRAVVLDDIQAAARCILDGN